MGLDEIISLVHGKRRRNAELIVDQVVDIDRLVSMIKSSLSGRIVIFIHYVRDQYLSGRISCPMYRIYRNKSTQNKWN
jgi:hypothetical protein